jgi:protein TonB
MDTARMQHGIELAPWRDRDVRLLSLFVAGSVVLHLVLAALLPHLRGADVPPPPLEVTLEKRELPDLTPAVPLPPEPVAPRVPPPREKPKVLAQKKIARPQPEKPAPSPQPPPVLALPQAPETPQFSVPAPQSDEKPAVPREDKAAQATPAPSAQRPAPAAETPVKTTPPISDAAYLQNPQPRYPMSARRRGEQGTVLLKVLVSREGSAASVSVAASSGSTSLDEAALEAVRRWRFVPAKRGAQPIEAWHLVPIVFKLEGTS